MSKIYAKEDLRADLATAINSTSYTESIWPDRGENLGGIVRTPPTNFKGTAPLTLPPCHIAFCQPESNLADSIVAIQGGELVSSGDPGYSSCKGVTVSTFIPETLEFDFQLRVCTILGKNYSSLRDVNLSPHVESKHLSRLLPESSQATLTCLGDILKGIKEVELSNGFAPAHGRLGAPVSKRGNVSLDDFVRLLGDTGFGERFPVSSIRTLETYLNHTIREIRLHFEH